MYLAIVKRFKKAFTARFARRKDHREIHYFHLPLRGQQTKNNLPPAGQ
jgi:ribosomal protein S13